MDEETEYRIQEIGERKEEEHFHPSFSGLTGGSISRIERR